MENQNSPIQLYSIQDTIKVNPYKSIHIGDCIESNFDLIENYVINDNSFCLNRHAFNHLLMKRNNISDNFVITNNNKFNKFRLQIENINKRYNGLHWSDLIWEDMWQGLEYYISFTGENNKDIDMGAITDHRKDKINWNNLIDNLLLDSAKINIRCIPLNKLSRDMSIIKYDLYSEINFGRYHGMKINKMIDIASNKVMDYVLKYSWFSLTEDAIQCMAKDKEFQYTFLYDIVNSKNSHKEKSNDAETRFNARKINSRNPRDLEFKSLYSGSYAYDEAGYSDDEIDSAFDGDPENYWNID